MNKIRTLTIRPVGNPEDPLWEFDDTELDIVSEPFVAGAEKAITKMARKKGKDITKPLTLIFSDEWFPGYHRSFRKLDTTPPSGTDYLCFETNEPAWLCNCLFKYYPFAPEEIYAAVR
jgi:hypothetical protein